VVSHLEPISCGIHDVACHLLTGRVARRRHRRRSAAAGGCCEPEPYRFTPGTGFYHPSVRTEVLLPQVHLH
jgi:hypothetical protein